MPQLGGNIDNNWLPPIDRAVEDTFLEPAVCAKVYDILEEASLKFRNYQQQQKTGAAHAASTAAAVAAAAPMAATLAPATTGPATVATTGPSRAATTQIPPPILRTGAPGSGTLASLTWNTTVGTGVTPSPAPTVTSMGPGQLGGRWGIQHQQQMGSGTMQPTTLWE